MEKILIVGASHAGVEAAFALRRFGWQGSIKILSQEKEFPYQKPPLSKAYLSDEIAEEQLNLKPQKLFEKNEIKTILNQKVENIFFEENNIVTNVGEKYSYDKLILATGASVRKLNCEGSDFKNIFYLRTKNDLDKIKNQIKPKSKFLIIGAGYIGLEVAASAIKMGHSATVCELQENILARVAGSNTSDFIYNYHKAKGVNFNLKTQIVAFEKSEDKTFAITQNNDKFEFDICIVGIGVLPNIDLANKCGIECENGILINQNCETSVKNIFAIGDVANQFNTFFKEKLRIESVPNAMYQAKIAASFICEKTPPKPEMPWFWSDQFDLKLQTIGILNGFTDQVLRTNAENSIANYYFKNEKLVALDAINAPKDFITTKKLLLAEKSPSKSELQNMEISIKEIADKILNG